MDTAISTKIIDLLQDGVVVTSTEGKVEWVNSSYYSLFNLQEGNLIEGHLNDHLPVGSRDEGTFVAINDVHALVVEKEGKTFYSPRGERQWCIRSDSNDYTPVEVQGEKVGDKYVYIVRDITNAVLLDESRNSAHSELNKISEVCKRVIRGDIDEPIVVPEKDSEYGDVYLALKVLVDDLEKSESISNTLKETGECASCLDRTNVLRKTNTHFETILENIWVGLVEFDNNVSVVRVNRAAEKLLGIKRASVLGKHVTPTKSKEGPLRSLAQIAYQGIVAESKKLHREDEGGTRIVHEMTIEYPEKRDLEVYTIPLTGPYGNRKEGFLKVLRDTTRENNINKSKSEFISIAAHQLRTPLSSMKWVLQLILDEDMGTLVKAQKDMLQKGYETNERMIHLVNDLLNVARIEEGRFDYSFEKGQVLKLLDELMGEFTVVAEEAGVKFTYEKPEIIEEFVFDGPRLTLAIQNIIGNAIKYTPQGGSVDVAVSVSDGNLTVKVADTGVGIPAEGMKKLFKKFFRAENVVRMEVIGTGLGLFIVKNIITRHGGDISVKSVEGEGTKFTVSIPLRQEDAG